MGEPLKSRGRLFVGKVKRRGKGVSSWEILVLGKMRLREVWIGVELDDECERW